MTRKMCFFFFQLTKHVFDFENTNKKKWFYSQKQVFEKQKIKTAIKHNLKFALFKIYIYIYIYIYMFLEFQNNNLVLK
jgi:hypothetical protein